MARLCAMFLARTNRAMYALQVKRMLGGPFGQNKNITIATIELGEKLFVSGGYPDEIEKFYLLSNIYFRIIYNT